MREYTDGLIGISAAKSRLGFAPEVIDPCCTHRLALAPAVWIRGNAVGLKIIRTAALLLHRPFGATARFFRCWVESPSLRQLTKQIIEITYKTNKTDDLNAIQNVRCVRTVRLGLPNTALLPYKMGDTLQRLLAVRGTGRNPQRAALDLTALRSCPAVANFNWYASAPWLQAGLENRLSSPRPGPLRWHCQG